MKLDDVLKEWKQDSVIDEFKLDESSIDSSRLHSKYLELYSHAKVELKGLELQFKTLENEKNKYYNGLLTKDDIDRKEWDQKDYDPYEGGKKPMKSDRHFIIDADKDMQKMIARIEEKKITIEVLKEILENVKWRHQNIKNIIAHRQFMAGG